MNLSILFFGFRQKSLPERSFLLISSNRLMKSTSQESSSSACPAKSHWRLVYPLVGPMYLSKRLLPNMKPRANPKCDDRFRCCVTGLRKDVDPGPHMKKPHVEFGMASKCRGVEGAMEDCGACSKMGYTAPKPPQPASPLVDPHSSKCVSIYHLRFWCHDSNVRRILGYLKILLCLWKKSLIQWALMRTNSEETHGMWVFSLHFQTHSVQTVIRCAYVW